MAHLTPNDYKIELDEHVGSLVRFLDIDKDQSSIQFGICADVCGSVYYNVFPIDSNGEAISKAQLVLKSCIKNFYGKIEYKVFAKENPEWII